MSLNQSFYQDSLNNQIIDLRNCVLIFDKTNNRWIFTTNESNKIMVVGPNNNLTTSSTIPFPITIDWSQITDIPSYYVYNGFSKQFILDSDVQVNTFNIDKLNDQSLNTVVLNLSPSGVWELTTIGDSYITDLNVSKLTSYPVHFWFGNPSIDKQYILDSDVQVNTFQLDKLQNATVNYSFVVSGSTDIWQQDQISSLAKFNNYFNATTIIDYSKLYQSISNVANSYFFMNGSSNNAQLTSLATVLSLLIPNGTQYQLYQMLTGSTQGFALLQNQSVATNTISVNKLSNTASNYAILGSNSSDVWIEVYFSSNSQFDNYFSGNLININHLYQNTSNVANTYFLMNNSSNNTQLTSIATALQALIPNSTAYYIYQMNSAGTAQIFALLQNNSIADNTIQLSRIQNGTAGYHLYFNSSTGVLSAINPSQSNISTYFGANTIDYSKIYQAVSASANTYFFMNSSNGAQLTTVATALQALIPNSTAYYIYQMNSGGTSQIFALLQNNSIADNTIQLSRIQNGTAGYHLYFNSSTGVLSAIQPTQTNISTYFSANTIDYSKLYQNVQTTSKYVLSCVSNGFNIVDVTTLVTGTLPSVAGAYNVLQVNSVNTAWTQGLLNNNNCASGFQFLGYNTTTLLNTGNFLFQSASTSSGYSMTFSNQDTGILKLACKANIQLGDTSNSGQGVAAYSGSSSTLSFYGGNSTSNQGINFYANYSGRSNDLFCAMNLLSNQLQLKGGNLGYSWLLQSVNNYVTTSPLGSAAPFYQKQLEGNVTNTMVYTDWMTNCSNGNGNPFWYLTTTSASTQIPYCVFYNSGSAASVNQIYGYTISRQLFTIQNEASASVSTHSNVCLAISNAGLDSWNSGPATYLPLNNTTWVVVCSTDAKQGVQAVSTNGQTFFNAVNQIGNLMQFSYKQPANLTAASFPSQLTEDHFQQILQYSTVDFKQTAQQLQSVNFMGAICSNQMPILVNNIGLSAAQWSQVQQYAQNKQSSQTNAQGNPLKTFVNFDKVHALYHQAQYEANQLIIALQNQVTTLQTQQTQDQSQLSTQGIQITTMNATIATQNSQIASLQSGMTALQNQNNSLQTQLNTLQNLLHSSPLLAALIPHT